MAQKNATKLTVKNGRKSKDGMAYNANHNTLEATRKQQSHIDQERTAQNIYIQFGRDGAMHFIKGGNGGFDARRHELRRYEQLYGAGLEARNERYKATRHDERCRTIKDLYQDPKTAPMETIFQVGNSKDDMSPEQRTQTLARAWEETAKLMQQKYGEHIVFLDSALHRDEAVDHIHCRVAFVGHDRHGHAVPSQNSALAAMGFERPDPSKPMTRYNNPTIPFTDELRETFYQACERRGIEVDREVKSYSRRQVEILEYKCEQYRLENAALEQMKNDHIKAAQEAEKKAKEAEERTKAAKKELEATKRLMESTTRKLRNQNLDLTNQIAQLNLQIEALTRTKEAAERAQTDAKNKRDVAVAAAKDMEEEQKRLFNIHNSRSIRAYGDYPAQPAKKGITGKVIQEARPACTLVSTEDLNKLKEMSAYSVTVDYTTATIAALDKKISENEIIQEQKDTISQLHQQIDNLERRTRSNPTQYCSKATPSTCSSKCCSNTDWIGWCSNSARTRNRPKCSTRNTTSIIIDKERQPPWASPGAVVFSRNDEIVGPGGQQDWWQLCQYGWPLYLGGSSAIILLDKLEFDEEKTNDSNIIHINGSVHKYHLVFSKSGMYN